MTFDFFPLRFEFVARELLYFPPGKAANILRGALGVIFRRIACIPSCQNTKTCEIRDSCPYARIFEPTMPQFGNAKGPSPSGISDWPRPFVFRARHLDDCTVLPGETFCFDLHVFSLNRDTIACFALSFAELAREGLGPRRAKADLLQVCTIPIADAPSQSAYNVASQTVTTDLKPTSIDLAPAPGPTRVVRVDFLSPTELKHEHRIASRPEFPILFARLRDRIGTLCGLYGSEPLDIDFQGSNDRASRVRMTHFEMQHRETVRRSSKTGQSHSIGGFVGTAEYEGDLAEFLPYLHVGRWTGVGRQVVWGKGEINVLPLSMQGPGPCQGLRDVVEPSRPEYSVQFMPKPNT